MSRTTPPPNTVILLVPGRCQREKKQDSLPAFILPVSVAGKLLDEKANTCRMYNERALHDDVVVFAQVDAGCDSGSVTKHSLRGHTHSQRIVERKLLIVCCFQSNFLRKLKASLHPEERIRFSRTVPPYIPIGDAFGRVIYFANDGDLCLSSKHNALLLLVGTHSCTTLLSRLKEWKREVLIIEDAGTFCIKIRIERSVRT